MVSRDSHIVDAKLLETHVFHSLPQTTNSIRINSSSSIRTSSNWSGYVINEPGLAYDIVQSEWNVPTIIGPPGGGPTSQAEYVAIWAGLGGWGARDIVQNGLVGQATPLGRLNPFWIISCNVWIEYYPGNSVQLSNFPLSFGDLIYSESWIGDSTGVVTPSGGYGWFYIVDVTNGHSYEGKIAKPNGAPAFSGTSAEWIVERGPNVNGLLPFADYQTVTMTNMLADANGSYSHDIATDQSINISMLSGNNLMSSVVQQGPQQAQFTWHAVQ